MIMRRTLPGTALLLAMALAGCGGGSSGAGDGAAVSAGERAYQVNCMACHADDGSGHPPKQPALTGSPVVNGEARAMARWVMLGERPPGWSPPRNTMPMPHFAWMKDEDLAALLTYVRTTFGPNASAVTAPDIAAARQPQ